MLLTDSNNPLSLLDTLSYSRPQNCSHAGFGTTSPGPQTELHVIHVRGSQSDGAAEKVLPFED